MGAWGLGNFDNDGAMDMLDAYINGLLKIIEVKFNSSNLESNSFLEEHGEVMIMPTIDLINLICRHYEVRINLTEEAVRNWKEKYLLTYDRDARDIFISATDVEQRKEVIENTFEELEKYILD